MEIDCQNLKVDEFFDICRLCLVKRGLEPLTEEEKSTLIKLTPWIAELETNVFFPNKICSDCTIQLQQMNKFLHRCTILANGFHECIEKYRESVRKDSTLPSLETIFVTTEVIIKQEVEEDDHEYEEEVCTSVPFTEVLVREDIKGEHIIEEDTSSMPQQTTSDQSIESASDITAKQCPQLPASTDQTPKSLNKLNDSNLENNADNDAPSFSKRKCLVKGCNGLQQGAKRHHLPFSKKKRERWLKNINRLDIINVPFTRSKNWGVCSKHFSSSAYKFPGSGILAYGAEPLSPFPIKKKAVPKAVVEEVHIECKETSAELCTDDVLRKTIKTYKRRRLQEIISDEHTTPFYVDLTS